MKEVHMRLAKVLMVILGIWPVKLSGRKLKLYNAYFYVSWAYYSIYNMTMAANVVISNGDFVVTASNLSVTIVYVINIYKVLIYRSATMRRILEEIDVREKIILQGDDQSLKDIYYKQVRTALISTIFYVFLGSFGISLYFITPIVKNMLETTNDDFGHKYLIFSSWFPFDSDKHYIAAYLIQFAGGFYGYGYITYATAFLFCILKFIVGQIKILQHIFKNFNQYVLKYSKENHLNVKNPQEVFVRLCIKEHQYLISLVERLDASIKMFLLLEFMISSFQLSLVVYQILQSSIFGVQKIAVFSYLATLCAQLFLFYWNAHEIIIQSTKIAQAVFECEWSDLDKNVQKMLVFVIQRAQKPLAISIGPIYQVRMDALITIFKAIYSYIAVIQK